MVIVRALRLLIFFAASILLLFVAGREFLRAQESKTPFAVRAGDLPRYADDHHYMAVSGQLITGAAVERRYRGKYCTTYNFYVPIAPARWDGREPIHSIALFRARTRQDALHAVRAALASGGTEQTVVGTQVMSLQSTTPAALFPGHQHPSPRGRDQPGRQAS